MGRRQWNHGRHVGYKQGFMAGVLATLKVGGWLAITVHRYRARKGSE